MKVLQGNKRASYGWVAGLAIGLLAWSVARAAPPDPETAAEIERALGGSSRAPSGPQQGGASNIGRLRGPAGIVNDPTDDNPINPQRASWPETLDYPTLIRSRPKVSALIHFDPNSAHIRNDAYRLLNEYARALKGTTLANVVLVIAGHTDATGPDELNLALSQERAEAVKEYLVRQGVSPERLIAKGYGETYPVASNATEADRELNRRSEFIRVDETTSNAP